MRAWFEAILAILICQTAGFIGSAFAYSSIAWYETLNRPSFNPPSWVFAPVWIALYTLMGISLYRIINSEAKLKVPIILFGTQLTMNVVWVYLFFGLHLLFYSFVEIIILWIAILATVISFYRNSKKAAWLMIPYLVLVSFAAILNYYVWILNF